MYVKNLCTSQTGCYVNTDLYIVMKHNCIHFIFVFKAHVLKERRNYTTKKIRNLYSLFNNVTVINL